VISHPLPAVALIGDMAAAQAGDPGSPVARGPFTTWGGRLPGGRVSVKDLARGYERDYEVNRKRGLKRARDIGRDGSKSGVQQGSNPLTRCNSVSLSGMG